MAGEAVGELAHSGRVSTRACEDEGVSQETVGRSPEAPAPPARSRGRKTGLDMVRSLAVIGAMVAVIYLLVPRPDDVEPPPVDLTGAVEVAQAAGDVPVVVPDLGDGWEVTSARRDRPSDAEPATWHLGYLTPAGGYAGLEVADDATATWLTRVTSDGTEAGVQDVDGIPWTVYESADPRRTSLVLEDGSRTTVVTGSAVLDELVELAGTVAATGTAP